MTFLQPGRGDHWWTRAIPAVYVMAMALFFPVTFTSTDEAAYVAQATGLLECRADPGITYPPGTALLQAPFIAAGGVLAAPLASVLSLVATVLVLAAWLRRAGYAPEFALLFVAYAPTLVMGRVATSDVPSAAIVAFGLCLLWTAGGARALFLAGLAAGASTLFRETNLVLFLPFLASAAWRRAPSTAWLLTGTAIGVAAGLVLRSLLVGSTVAGISPSLWSLDSAVESAPLYALALLVLVPGGLVAVGAYRGRHRRALQAAVALHVPIYLFYGYGGEDSGTVERVAAAGRYFIPLVPLMTIAWADVASRQLRGLRRLVPVARWLVLVLAIAVHPTVYTWSARDAGITRAIASAAAGGVVIADTSQRKYLSPDARGYQRIWMSDVPPSRLSDVLVRGRPTYIVLVSRSENAAMAERWAIPQGYIADTHDRCQIDPVHDRYYGAAARLQIWRLQACRGDASR